MLRKRRILWMLLSAVAVTLATGAAILALVKPSNDRPWKTEHARLASAEFHRNRVDVTNIRDFRTVSADSVEAGYYDKSFDLDEIESVWFVLSIFDKENWKGPAHSMLSFGFKGGHYVVISVEARKEIGESYSTVRGLFKKYEIIYVVGDERDLVQTRAVHRTDHVYIYPIRTTPENIRKLFVGMLETANELHDRPQFYNTITNNCTTKLKDHVNEVVPGRIPSSWKVLLPGYSDGLLEDLGLLDSNVTLEEARERYLVNDRARRYANRPDFSAKIREPS